MVQFIIVLYVQYASSAGLALAQLEPKNIY